MVSFAKIWANVYFQHVVVAAEIKFLFKMKFEPKLWEMDPGKLTHPNVKQTGTILRNWRDYKNKTKETETITNEPLEKQTNTNQHRISRKCC